MGQQDDKLWYGPMHANSNVICALDIRVDSEDPIHGNLLEIAIIPLNHSFRPHPTMPLFHIKIKPSFPVDIAFARLSKPDLQLYQDSHFDIITSVEIFTYWLEKLQLKNHKRILPLVWDYQRIYPWLVSWLGRENFKEYFAESYRDLLVLLNFINDKQDHKGNEIPYKHPTFDQLVVRSGQKLIERNAILANAKVLSDCYRHMLKNY